jgi:KRAB domain-containing zinc finger protein
VKCSERCCLKMFLSLSDWHLVIDTQPPPVLPCPTCTQTFRSKVQLKDHLKTHPLSCRVCGKVQPDKSKMERHMLVHTQIKEFRCTYCERTFTHNCNRKTHERLHTGEKPYCCSLCSFSSAQMSNMRSHMRFRHKHAMPDLYDLSPTSDVSVCKLCDQVFSCNITLKLHMDKHPSIPCNLCSKKFKDQGHLTRHFQMQHPGTQPRGFHW